MMFLRLFASVCVNPCFVLPPLDEAGAATNQSRDTT